VFLLSVKNIPGFAICYALGSICSICSSLFIVGPWGQLKNMCKPHRAIATVMMFSAIGFTLFSAM